MKVLGASSKNIRYNLPNKCHTVWNPERKRVEFFKTKDPTCRRSSLPAEPHFTYLLHLIPTGLMILLNCFLLVSFWV